MKRKAALIIAVALLLAAAGGCLFLYRLLNSAEYALKTIADEVHAKGVDALERHLTENLQPAFRRVRDMMNQPLAQAAADAAAVVLDALEQSAGKWTYQVAYIHTSGSHSIITLRLDGGSFYGNVNIEMLRQKGRWRISDVSIPLSSWAFS